MISCALLIKIYHNLVGDVQIMILHGGLSACKCLEHVRSGLDGMISIIQSGAWPLSPSRRASITLSWLDQAYRGCAPIFHPKFSRFD